MKVLYVSKAAVVAAYRSKLRALGQQVELTAVIPERWGSEEVEGSEVAACPIRRERAWLHGHNHLHLYPDAAAILDSERPDLLHIDEEPYSAVTFQFVRLARRAGIPSLFFAWQNLYKRLPPPFNALRRYVYRHADAAIAGTETAVRVLRRGGYQGPITVIPQVGVDPAVFAPNAEAGIARRREIGLSDDAFVVGYGGRLVPEKGVQVLVAAVARTDGAHLLIVGDGPQRPELERLAARLGVTDRVRFAGRVPSLAMPSWLAAMDALVLPSSGNAGWVEQFGRILVEAMMCEVPVVGSRCGEIPEVVGEAGLLFEKGDVEGLSVHLDRLRDPARRRALSRRGRERAERDFGEAGVARRTAAFYRQVVRPAVAT